MSTKAVVQASAPLIERATEKAAMPSANQCSAPWAKSIRPATTAVHSEAYAAPAVAYAWPWTCSHPDQGRREDPESQSGDQAEDRQHHVARRPGGGPKERQTRRPDEDHRQHGAPARQPVGPQVRDEDVGEQREVEEVLGAGHRVTSPRGRRSAR